jgi:hypothetical protein
VRCGHAPDAIGQRGLLHKQCTYSLWSLQAVLLASREGLLTLAGRSWVVSRERRGEVLTAGGELPLA